MLAVLLIGCSSGRPRESQVPGPIASPPEEPAVEPALVQEGPMIEPRPSRDDLDRLQRALPQSSSAQELKATLREIRGVIGGLDDLSFAERITVESAIATEVSRWVQGRPDARTLGAGEPCLANSQCGERVCAGQGCMPGSWTCRDRVLPDQRVTHDMRTACLCSGQTYFGSSTVLRDQRVYSSRAACPEDLPAPPRRRPGRP